MNPHRWQEWVIHDRRPSRRDVLEAKWYQARWILHAYFPEMDKAAEGRAELDELCEALFERWEAIEAAA